MQQQKIILYLRTDISHKPLVAGGSVGHTMGVVQGFLDNHYSVVCATSVMYEQLNNLPLKALYRLANPWWLLWLKSRINCLLSTVIFLKQTLPIVQKHTITIIYQRYSMFNCTGILLSRLKNIPLCLEYNGSEVWVDIHWTTKSWFRLRWLIHLIEYINIHYANTIIVISKVLKDNLIARGVAGNKILVNPNGVNPLVFNSAILENQRNRIRKKFGLEDKFVFCFAGTFSPWHGIGLLASIIPSIVLQQSRAHFLFVGDGPLRIFLQEKLAHYSQAITFTGLVPYDQSSHYLSAADAFLSPTQPNTDGSPFFGSPTKLFEYMSMGKPIIASNIEQLADIINPALTDCASKKNAVGILVNPEDIQGFITAALILVQLSQDLRQLIGSNARQKVIDCYTWQNHVQSIIQFWSHKHYET